MMPPARSKIQALPDDVRQELDRELIERGFGDYRCLESWLITRGYQISRSSLHRYGSQLERRIQSVRLSTEMATTLIETSPDDAGAMADASIRLVQDKMFDLLLASEEDDLQEITRAARAIAETARASSVIRAERRKILSDAQAEVAKVARSEGLSEDVMAKIDAVLMPA